MKMVVELKRNSLIFRSVLTSQIRRIANLGLLFIAMYLLLFVLMEGYVAERNRQFYEKLDDTPQVIFVGSTQYSTALMDKLDSLQNSVGNIVLIAFSLRVQGGAILYLPHLSNPAVSKWFLEGKGTSLFEWTGIPTRIIDIKPIKDMPKNTQKIKPSLSISMKFSKQDLDQSMFSISKNIQGKIKLVERFLTSNNIKYWEKNQIKEMEQEFMPQEIYLKEMILATIALFFPIIISVISVQLKELKKKVDQTIDGLAKRGFQKSGITGIMTLYTIIFMLIMTTIPAALFYFYHRKSPLSLEVEMLHFALVSIPVVFHYFNESVAPYLKYTKKYVVLFVYSALLLTMFMEIVFLGYPKYSTILIMLCTYLLLITVLDRILFKLSIKIINSISKPSHFSFVFSTMTIEALKAKKLKNHVRTFWASLLLVMIIAPLLIAPSFKFDGSWGSLTYQVYGTYDMFDEWKSKTELDQQEISALGIVDFNIAIEQTAFEMGIFLNPEKITPGYRNIKDNNGQIISIAASKRFLSKTGLLVGDVIKIKLADQTMAIEISKTFDFIYPFSFGELHLIDVYTTVSELENAKFQTGQLPLTYIGFAKRPSNKATIERNLFETFGNYKEVSFQTTKNTSPISFIAAFKNVDTITSVIMFIFGIILVSIWTRIWESIEKEQKFIRLRGQKLSRKLFVMPYFAFSLGSVIVANIFLFFFIGTTSTKDQIRYIFMVPLSFATWFLKYNIFILGLFVSAWFPIALKTGNTYVS